MPTIAEPCERIPSPSTRRAWIEIVRGEHAKRIVDTVALHPEGVDRNRHRDK